MHCFPIQRRPFPAIVLSRSTSFYPRSFYFSNWKDFTSGKTGEAQVNLKFVLNSKISLLHAQGCAKTISPLPLRRYNQSFLSRQPIRFEWTTEKASIWSEPAGSNDRNFQVYTIESVTGYVQGTAQERVYTPFEMFSPKSGCRSHFPHEHPAISGAARVRFLSLRRLSARFRRTTARDSLHRTAMHQWGGARRASDRGYSKPHQQYTGVRRVQKHHTAHSRYRGRSWGATCTGNCSPIFALTIDLWPVRRTSRRFLSFTISKRTGTALPFWQIKRRWLASKRCRPGPRTGWLIALSCAGREIRLNLRQDNFAGVGDLFLFGSVLDHFLGLYASLNTYTQLTVKEALKGEVYQWPPRIGVHPLI